MMSFNPINLPSPAACVYTSAASSSSPSPSLSISSPVKIEPQQQQQHSQLQTHNSNLFSKASSPSPKTIAKIIKSEDIASSQSPSNSPLVNMSQSNSNLSIASTSSGAVNHLSQTSKVNNEPEYDNNDFNDTMIGIDLEKEKKLLNASTNKVSNLDQIKACKDEKFLNIVILHKKFVDIGESYVLYNFNSGLIKKNHFSKI